jgi:GNAT superfamily N-acetyltransferase
MPIRIAVPDDLDIIQKLNRQIFEYEHAHCDPHVNLDYPYQEAGIAYFKKCLEQEDGNAALIYEENGEALGYASVRLVDDKDVSHRVGIKLAQLQTLCVAEGCRGSGIGKQLVGASKAWAKERGANMLKVAALAKNDYARAFYKTCGFEELEVHHEIKI